MNKFLAERYMQMFGSDFRMFEQSISKPMPKYIRVNRMRIDNDKLKKRLEKKGFILKKRMKNCFLVKRGSPLGATTEYLLGYYIIEDWTSMIPVLALNPKGVVWDMCASPGVKTTHLSEEMRNKGVIVATDYDKKRMNSLAFNCMRMGTKNVVAYNRKAEDIEYDFDGILLDAPCSGTGIIRKDATRKRVNKREIMKFQKIQKLLMDSAINNLKTGGTLVYSTCSMEPEENECVVEYAMEHGMNLEKINIEKANAMKGFTEVLGYNFPEEMKKTIRIMPYESSGFFVAKMVKK